jgi:hypothetical protein
VPYSKGIEAAEKYEEIGSDANSTTHNWTTVVREHWKYLGRVQGNRSAGAITHGEI